MCLRVTCLQSRCMDSLMTRLYLLNLGTLLARRERLTAMVQVHFDAVAHCGPTSKSSKARAAASQLSGLPPLVGVLQVVRCSRRQCRCWVASWIGQLLCTLGAAECSLMLT